MEYGFWSLDNGVQNAWSLRISPKQWRNRNGVMLVILSVRSTSYGVQYIVCTEYGRSVMRGNGPVEFRNEQGNGRF